MYRIGPNGASINACVSNKGQREVYFHYTHTHIYIQYYLCVPPKSLSVTHMSVFFTLSDVYLGTASDFHFNYSIYYTIITICWLTT